MKRIRNNVSNISMAAAGVLLAITAIACAQLDSITNPVAPTLTPLPTLTPIGPFEANEFGDAYQTGSSLPINFGEAMPAQLATKEQAHNWLFEGTSGETVTIRVEALSGDPNMRLFDPNLRQVGADDDGGGELSSLLTMTLPETGTYTIRINLIEIGQYEVSLNRG